MTDAPRAYELWSFETGNCVGVYGTLDEALDIVEQGVAGMRRAEAVAWVGDLALVIDIGVAGEREAYSEATELLDIALGRNRKPIAERLSTPSRRPHTSAAPDEGAAFPFNRRLRPVRARLLPHGLDA